jgi:endonuclease YncB( thermonuclease family)
LPGEGTNINDLLLKNGYVFSWLEYEYIPKDLKKIFIASEQNAKKNKR